ncbi:Polycomb group RING finger protein 3 [Hordeum vulgare]|nr:Polycomb group RING finger protein 3 [Hordeum vulgare]
MGYAPGLARVPRALLAPCVTCPLCRGYFREASAFSECGHTFCRECIMKKIDEEEIEACPVCDVALGITPEEKLRADISIQAIRNNLFPPKSEVDAVEAPTITLPAKRKERSISSLVEIPKVATQSTLTGRRTKAARRTIISHKFSLGKLPNKSEDRNQTVEKALALKSTKMTTSANKKQNSVDISEDGKNHETIDKEELEKPLQSLVVASAKKSQKSSSCLEETHKNKTTTEDGPRESPEADPHDRITTQVWFSLVTSPNQVEAKLLPQLEKNFYRIKDGTMRVSSILMLIMKKLELASDDKVEILCHDKPVCPSTTLHGLLKRWVSCKPKDEVQRPVGAPANEFVMELRYRRCLAPRPLCCTMKTASLPCHCST